MNIKRIIIRSGISQALKRRKKLIQEIELSDDDLITESEVAQWEIRGFKLNNRIRGLKQQLNLGSEAKMKDIIPFCEYYKK